MGDGGSREEGSAFRSEPPPPPRLPGSELTTLSLWEMAASRAATPLSSLLLGAQERRQIGRGSSSSSVSVSASKVALLLCSRLSQEERAVSHRHRHRHRIILSGVAPRSMAQDPKAFTHPRLARALTGSKHSAT
jgi:hypothetical protein